MGEAVVRKHGEIPITGDFSKTDPTKEELLTLVQRLRAELMCQIELKNENKRLKKELDATKTMMYGLRAEHKQFKDAIKATDVNQLLEAAKTVMKATRKDHPIRSHTRHNPK
jgi:hypothetical protein